MPKFIRYLLAALILGALLFALGPRPQFAPLDPQPDPRRWPIDEVASVVLPREAALPDLKPGNAAYFVWADSTAPTDYALVYLHGFSASPREGGPLHERFADHYGYNLYLPRLPGHGLAGPDAFAGPEAKDWVDAAKEAVAIGKSIGRRVILMATSTGATLALYLAAADPDIAALILMAPNIDLYSSSSRLLNGPWGRPLARAIFGGNYREWAANDTVQAYWTTRYHLQGLHELRYLVDETMQPVIFQAVRQPLFVGYYAQDDVVSVPAIEAFLTEVGTPAAQRTVSVSNNAGCHALGCDLWNPHWPEVEAAIWSFWDQNQPTD